ncbi:Hypothetical protein FKW44_023003 [Caligus rogercresseyi]|uniref:CRESS-DNA virus Rep endonuclease domain-containing protein n=1 Tax=Caligus rogercresseyi TaxID=217165 RepID=A0A7T8GNQ3_CALRO|nr:Hypothetical protein FKW44_023003 [Caligus rogercresseyi]
MESKQGYWTSCDKNERWLKFAIIGEEQGSEGTIHLQVNMVRSNKICFTLNNYEDGEQAGILDFLDKNERWVKFAIIGEEQGSEGTIHLQGYINLKTAFLKAINGNLKFWKKVPGLQRAHLEDARGDDLHTSNTAQRVVFTGLGLRIKLDKDIAMFTQLGELGLVSHTEKLAWSNTPTEAIFATLKYFDLSKSTMKPAVTLLLPNERSY